MWKRATLKKGKRHRLLTVLEAEYEGGLLMFGVPPVFTALCGANPRKVCDTVVSDGQIP